MQLYPGMSSDRKLVHAFACDDQPDVNQGQYVGYKPFDSRSVGVEITSDKKSRTHFFCRQYLRLASIGGNARSDRAARWG